MKMTREEAINQLGWLKCKTNKERHLEAIDMAIEALEAMDNTENTLQHVGSVERLKGRWALPNKELTDRPMAECSICGWYVNPKWVDDYNFCPNCGADMRGEDE